MFLAAHALGLGTCWINQLTWLGQMKNVRDFLQSIATYQKEHVICGACAVGYTNGAYPKPAPRKENTNSNYSIKMSATVLSYSGTHFLISFCKNLICA